MFEQWYKNVSDDVAARAQNIKLLICDIDGVFSDGTIFIGNDGEELKGFNTKDGFGIKALMSSGVDVAIITGRSSNIVNQRMASLGITHIYQGMEDKIQGFNALCKDLNLSPEQVAYIGDDFPDVPVMLKVGLAISVEDGHPYVKQISHYVTTTKGGKGAVREATDLIISVQQGSDYLIKNLIGSSA